MSKLQLGGEFIQVRDSTLINRGNYRDMLVLWGIIEDNGYKIFLNFTERTTSRRLNIMELSTMQYLPGYNRDGNDLKYVHKVLIEFYEKVLKEKISERKNTI